MIWFLGYVAFHLLCGFVTVAAARAYFMGEFPELYDTPKARRKQEAERAFLDFWAYMAGPVMLVLTPALTGGFEHGFKWLPPKEGAE